MWTDDPVRDAIRHDREQQRKLDRLPKCDICGEPIQDDTFIDYNGEYICEGCLDTEFRKRTENYIE